MKKVIFLFCVTAISACQNSSHFQIKAQKLGDDTLLNLVETDQVSENKYLLESNTQIIEYNLSGFENRQQGEVSVSVNRADPQNAVAAMMDIDLFDGNRGGLLVATTYDGGENWSTQKINPSREQGFFVNYLADPMLAFDAEGRVFLTYIPVSENSPQAIDVIRSVDGGTTWSEPLRVSKGTNRDDKVAIAVDDHPDSPYFGNVYISWKWPGGPTWFSRSIDHGLSFSARKNISSLGPSGLDLGVAQDGTVLLTYNVGSGNNRRKGITVQRSLDGGVTFNAPQRVGTTIAGFETFPLAHCRSPGAFINASIDADKSSELGNGQVLLTWVDYKPGTVRCSDPCNNDCQTVVRFATSNDTGKNWSSVRSIPATTGSQFFQWSDIDQATGDWYITYKDTSFNENHKRTETVLIKSTDKGQNWSAPIKLSSDSGSTIRWPGHYQGLAAHNGKVYASWPDYRSNFLGDMYVATWTEPKDSFEITGSISGPWYIAEQSGHGWFLEVLDGVSIDEPDRLLAYWHVFHQGKPIWLVANGVIDGDTAEMDVTLTDGGEFPPNFVGADVFYWGTLIFKFNNETEGVVNWDSIIEGFSSGSQPIKKIANISSSPNACLSGSYYNSSQSGHGISLEILSSLDADQILLAWNAYFNGEQIWLLGLSDFDINSAETTIPLVTYRGANFPPSFNTESVITEPWGDLSIKFIERGIELNWLPIDDRFTAGNMNMSRLTQLKDLACN